MSKAILVIRPKNAEMAKEASRIAQELSAAPSRESNFKYSMAKALFSLVSGAELNDEALKRYLKGAAYAYNKIEPLDKNGIRDFFCSYFVGWALSGRRIDAGAKNHQRRASFSQADSVSKFIQGIEQCRARSAVK